MSGGCLSKKRVILLTMAKIGNFLSDEKKMRVRRILHKHLPPRVHRIEELKTVAEIVMDKLNVPWILTGTIISLVTTSSQSAFELSKCRCH